ncbi:hypothetical protein scyTo_0006700 [Scyliorhinus torazame]|uniref:Uncharacterized protein n=1 Tax=Scyliorhinus torazame TaxID=75743 RepID=A0A401PJH3_SCYTO|nr:hypothetical protein [Scyliorhinus torazame]
MELPVNAVERGRAGYLGTANRHRISVHKLREVTSLCGGEESVYIPPALPVNKPRSDKSASDTEVSKGTSPPGHVIDFRKKSTGDHAQKAINENKLPQWVRNCLISYELSSVALSLLNNLL